MELLIPRQGAPSDTAAVIVESVHGEGSLLARTVMQMDSPISDAVGSKGWTVEPNPETMVRLRSTSIEVSRVFSANHRKVIIAAIM